MTKKRPLFSALLIAVMLAHSAAWAETGEIEPEKALLQALTEGDVHLNFRYRFEYVDQDGLPKRAKAHTLRSALGYKTGIFHGFSAFVEAENIIGIGHEAYNDTIKGKTNYPVVADPGDTNINQFYLDYTALPDTRLRLGRQLINLDNQRFIGSVGWRQNDQSFDAISLHNQSLPETTLFYAYANQVNRIFGRQSPDGVWNGSHIHLVNTSWTGLPLGKVTGYAYLLDIPDSVAVSSATYGLRFEGKYDLTDKLTGLLNLDYAHQTDHADNPADFHFNYYAIEPGAVFGQWLFRAKYESIAGNGSRAMQFPLGTNHAFGGWMDKFLTTPVDGLVTAQASARYAVKSDNAYLDGLTATLAYHRFFSERGGSHYGDEWNALIEQKIGNHCTFALKLGHYNADALLTDTLKIMPYMQVRF